MEPIVKAIKISIESENYFGALFLALALPDICGAIETPKEKNGVRYKRWFRENLNKYYAPDNKYELMKVTTPHVLDGMDEGFVNMLKLQGVGSLAFTDEMCWKLRNAVLHTGTNEVKGHKFHFSHTMADRNLIQGVLQLSAIVFCDNFCLAYDEWLEKIKGDADIEKRLGEGMEVQNYMFSGLVKIG
ncbi:MAG: hypothetical protein GXW94_19755 [Serratia liquefaciens]|nr:hypothetical protein [Serratia liquefaciens]